MAMKRGLPDGSRVRACPGCDAAGPMWLVQIAPGRGEPYEHRCPRASFEQVAHAIDELGDETFTLESLVQREDLPFTQVAVALVKLSVSIATHTRLQNRT